MNDSLQTQTRKPSVFISYARESAAHQAAVQKLVTRLEDEHISVVSDHSLLEAPPAQGWRRWTEQQVLSARVVLVVCSPALKAQFEGHEDDKDGSVVDDATSAGALVTRPLFELARAHAQFFPLLTDEGQFDDVPAALTPWHRDFRFPSGMARLLKLITHALRQEGGQAVAKQACAVAVRDTPTLDPSIRSVPPPAPTKVTWRSGALVFGALGALALAMGQGSREARAKRSLARADEAMIRGDLIAARRPLEMAKRLSMLDNDAERDVDLIDAYRAYLDGAESEQVIRHVDRALEADGSQPHAYVLRGHVRAAEQQWDLASKDYQQALSIYPRHLGAQLGLARLSYRQGDLEKAAELLKQAQAWAPSDAQVLYQRGEVLLAQDEPDRAQPLLAAATKRDPSYLPPALALAASYRRAGEFGHALEALLAVEGEINTGADRGLNHEFWAYRLPQTEARGGADIQLRTRTQKQYLYGLQLALTACLAKEGDRLEDSLERLEALRTSAEVPSAEASAPEALTVADALHGHAAQAGAGEASRHCLEQLDLHAPQ